MGRSTRKGVTAPGGHWTETHPDRHLWSPGRLAQARTQTQEEYEALYGRGEATLPARRKLSQEDIKNISDEEILQMAAEACPLYLHEGASLYNKEKEEYQTVSLRMSPGVYQGFAVFRDASGQGRETLIASGTNIAHVAKLLNEYISDQQAIRGYRSRSYPNQISGKISPSQVRLVAEREVLKLNTAKEEEKG